MAALLYLPSGAVSEEGGSVGRARHQGGSAARGLSSTTCKERAKTPRLRGSRSEPISCFSSSPAPTTPHPRSYAPACTPPAVGPSLPAKAANLLFTSPAG